MIGNLTIKSCISQYMRVSRRAVVRISYAVCCWALGAAAALAGPVIINPPFSAQPGDIISLGGSGFGTAPQVYIKPSKQLTSTVLATKTADDGTVVVQVPKAALFDVYEVWITNGGATSNHILLNAPKPLHFDNAEIAPGAHFRIFGRNLYVNNVPPTVTLVDVQTKVPAIATVTTSTSSAYSLDVAPLLGVIAGRRYQVNVSNGYASTLSDASIVAHASGTDHFSIGQPWAYDFLYQDGPGYQAGVKGTNQADHHVFNVKTDPSLALLATGDGVTNDRAAIQGAIATAAAHRGVVFLPAGTYNIGSAKIDLKPNVVLQGESAASTKIIFGPAAGAGIIVDTGGMSGFADLTIQNVDLSSNAITNIGTWGQPIAKFFIQRVAWNLGSGAPIFLTGDRIAILNSTFVQAINYQNGSVANQTGGLGPLYLSKISNLQFRNNTIKWATNQNSMNDLVNAIIENNHFTRSASDTIIAGPAQASWTYPFTEKPVVAGESVARVDGRQLTINFGKNVVVQNNRFDVSDGVLSIVHNDGETILNEAGGSNTREDWGTVTGANRSSVTDNSKCSSSPCAWKIYPNSMLIIVSGAGAGQWRHITAQMGNTFTVDAPFDVVPTLGDHFTLAVPAYENTIISNNTATGNPFGIAMYHGSYLNVVVSGNRLTDNGGIYFMSEGQLSTSRSEPGFDATKNIEINGNILTNTTGAWPSYIALGHLMINPNYFWGKNVIGAEVRNNSITARAGTPLYLFDEGYHAFTYYQAYPATYVEKQGGALFGTVFQGNSCANCPVNYALGTGATDTTIWNAATTNSPGITSTFLKDTPMASGAAGSIRTLVGHD